MVGDYNSVTQVGEGSGYQPIIVTSADQLGMVEEEVTTEIIKSEIQVDDDSSHFQIKNESVEYENGLDMKKVIVTKVSWKMCRLGLTTDLHF